MDNKTPAVTMRNITKTFGPVVANDKVWLDIYRGEILALLGENGSGKTTLMNMLSGIYFPDEGTISIDGKDVVIRSPKDAFDLGIGMIHQHFKLVDVLTAAENIVLGLPGKLDLKTAADKIRSICDAYGFEVDPNQKIYDMSVSQKQTVEIVKVLYRGADILILDEPTAVLTPQETDKLFAVLRNMRNDDAEHRPARSGEPKAADRGQGPDRPQHRGHRQAGRRQLYRQFRRDFGHRGHLRLRPEGAAGGHRRSAAGGGRLDLLY